MTQATGNFGKFVEASENARKSATGLEKSAKGLGDNFAAYNLIAGRLPGPLKDIASVMMGLVSPATAATGAVIALTEAAVKFASGSLEAFGEYEMIKTNLELVMGSAEAAAGKLAELRDLAGKTPFSLPGVSQAASMLRQAGVAAGDLVSVIETLGNVSGGNMERFNRIAYNYTQVLQKGIMDARDTREFAGNLVPINKILQEMGVTGQATADDMVEAFRRMTAEGGMFFNSINRQGDTLIGKTEQMKEAWTEFQATWAETSGLGKLWKTILDNVTESLKKNTEAMALNQELQSLNDKKKAGTDTALDDYRRLSILLQMAENDLHDLSGSMNKSYRGFDMAKALADQRAYIANLTEQRENLQDTVDIINARNAAEAAWQETTTTSASDYLTLQSQIQEAYAKTAAGQEEALENEIKLWRERQQATHLELIEIDMGNGMSAWENVGISDEEYKKIDAIIKKLKEGFENMKAPLEDWQQLLKSTLDISDQAALDQLAAIEEYTTGFYNRLEGSLSYARLAGEDAAEVYGEFADEIERAMKALMYSGKFDINDNAIQGLSVLFDKIDAMSTKIQRIDIRGILGLGEGSNLTAFNQYLGRMEDRLHIFATIRDPSYKKPLAPGEFEIDNGDGTFGQDYSKAASFEKNYMDKMGISLSEAYADMAQKMRAVIEELFAQGQIIPDSVLGAYQTAKNLADDADKEERGAKYITGLEKQRDLEKQLLTGEISRNEYAAQQLSIQQNISIETARDAVNLQNQIEQYQILGNVLQQLGELGLSSLIDMAHELGEAFRDGTDAGDAMSAALGNMIRNMINALPQLLLYAGVQLMTTGNWQLGLAFIAASGLASFVSGLIPDSGKDGAEDQVAKLQKIQDEISKLIDQQKNLEEYYFKKRQELNAKASMSVNDLIVTPQGSFSTHPDDFIIATKRPETLGSGGGTRLNVKIVNNAGAVVATQQGIGADGLDELLVMVDRRIQNNIASGRFDGSFATRDFRLRGRDVRS
ncbi:MAG: tape measure protein [Treponema sp.]|nr:tape measure protein [Treponema sp.]